MKVTTTQCGDIKVSIGYDEGTDRAMSMKIDISELTPDNILTSMQILQGILELGKNGEGDE